jgi:hypothetical protein
MGDKVHIHIVICNKIQNGLQVDIIKHKTYTIKVGLNTKLTQSSSNLLIV